LTSRYHKCDGDTTIVMNTELDFDTFRAALQDAMNRADLNQSQLGRTADVSPQMISAWLLRKTSSPEPAKVFAVERALGLMPGTLSRHLGYIPARNDDVMPPVDARSAIETDPYLDDDNREAVLELYEVFRRRSAPTATVSETPASRAAKPSRRASRS